MQQDIKIGFLLPRSVLYPAMAFDLYDGLRYGLMSGPGPKKEPKILSSNIGVAAKQEEVYAHCEQLLLQGADVVVAYINPHTAQWLHPLFTASGRRLLVLDSGYHFPSFTTRLSHADFISLEGNLCCRAIAQKATSDGHRQFALACSFYDAGYRPSYTYTQTTEEEGAQIGFHHITPLRRADFSLDSLTTYLSAHKETALLASFCGDMAEDFFTTAANLNLIADYPLYASAFTAEELWLGKILYPGKDWYCAVPWSVRLDSTANRDFVRCMQQINEQKANLFSLLGWEAALYIQALRVGRDIKTEVFNSPRGELTINPQNGYAEAPVYYARVSKNEETGNCLLTDIQPVPDIEKKRAALQEQMKALDHQVANSWLNAYACLES